MQVPKTTIETEIENFEIDQCKTNNFFEEKKDNKKIIQIYSRCIDIWFLLGLRLDVEL